MREIDSETEVFITNLYHKNPWYTTDNVSKQFSAIAANLDSQKLSDWLTPYPDFKTDKSVGLVLAGNLPLVGFHDILCTLVLGFTAKIKTSSDDAGLTAYVLQKLIGFNPELGHRIQLLDRLDSFDLVIATGSNNSARYFEYYFGRKPHIIRRNRNAIAILHGNETSEELAALGSDIFDYFGLGCRSVSKIYVPKGYNISTLFQAMESYSAIRDHFKYSNNYDYNKSIYLINRDKHYDNGFLLLKEDEALASPLAVLHYEEYEDIQTVAAKINAVKEAIQCAISIADVSLEIPLFKPGQSQCPGLDDYADHVNTLEFLWENR